MSKAWQKVLIGTGLVVLSPIVIACAAEVAAGLAFATVVATVGTALVSRGTEELCNE